MFWNETEVTFTSRECTQYRSSVHVEMVNMANSCVFCHSRRKMGECPCRPWGSAGEAGSGLSCDQRSCPARPEPLAVWQIQGSLKHLKAIVQYKEEIRTRLQNLYSVGPRRGGQGRGRGLGAEVSGSRSPPGHPPPLRWLSAVERVPGPGRRHLRRHAGPGHRLPEA